MRRKKHLNERLDAVKDFLIIPERDIVNVNEAIKDKRYFDFEKMFHNNNHVELEIGCGKGGFIVEKAKRNNDVNYIAVEMLENIVVMAAELAQKEKLANVKFINSGAEYLPRYIKEQSIDTLYLNFSPPYPRLGYESRRLTSDRFLPEYKSFLKSGGEVVQKTDDKEFFIYSFNKFVEYGFTVEDVSSVIDDKEFGNVQTEYEKKFKSKGMPIYALIAKKN